MGLASKNEVIYGIVLYNHLEINISSAINDE